MKRNELFGLINDIDSHEMILPTRWGEVFGQVGELLGPIATARLREIAGDIDVGLDAKRDDIEVEINHETVRSVRGFTAPGAENFSDRLKVMDEFGIKRQIVFPMFGLFAHMFRGLNAGDLKALGLDLGPDSDTKLVQICRQIQDAHNGWAKNLHDEHSDRLAPTAILGWDSVRELIDGLQKIIDTGLPSVTLTCGLPLGGKSPGHPDLDPFWAECAKNNLPVLLHVGADKGFTASEIWRELPQLESEPSDTGEVPLDAFSLDTTFLAARNYVSAMVLGGVFERHPELRLGIVELGAGWIGPMAESMDMYSALFSKKMNKVLSMKPSEYVNRNIRASSFWFEPVDIYLSRYGLEDVYCFASDYPHPEGGKDPAATHYDRLKHLGPGVLEKFFRTNAEWIMPLHSA